MSNSFETTSEQRKPSFLHKAMTKVMESRQRQAERYIQQRPLSF
ncbi:hypothetical protein [Consotaella aegiceratis]